MCSSYPKGFVDHTRNLSSTEKTVFHLGLQTDFLLEVWVHDDLFHGRRNLRNKKLKIRESMPSNLLRRLNIVHWIDHLHFFDPQHNFRGKVTTGTYLGFETRLPTLKMSKYSEIYRNAFPRPDSSIVQTYNFADKLFLHESEDSKLKTSWQISVRLSQGFKYFFVIHQFSIQIFLCLQTPDRNVHLQDFLHFTQKKMLSVHLVQVDLHKTFSDVP